MPFHYDHNWNGDINKYGELDGMHYDIMCNIEYQGLVKKLYTLQEEFYQGIAYCKGKWVEKS